MHIIKSKKPIWKDYTYAFIYTTSWKRQNYNDKIISGFKLMGWKRVGDTEQSNFRTVKLLCMVLWWLIPMECAISRVKHKVNNKVLVIIWECSFNLVANVLLCWMMITEEAIHVWSKECTCMEWEISTLSLMFCEPKTGLKHSLQKKWVL